MKKILVIDDSETLQESMRGLLAAKYQLLAAMDGVQGIMIAQNAKPDLIILDMQMPAGGGQTVFERLRQTQSTMNIPVVIHTSIAGVKAPAGSLGLIPKTMPAVQVAAAIDRILG